MEVMTLKGASSVNMGYSASRCWRDVLFSPPGPESPMLL